MNSERSEELPWYEAVDMVRPYVVRIRTPRGSGTGFLVARSNTAEIVGIATAAHVVQHAHLWEEPIRLWHPDSDDTTLLRRPDRAIFFRHKQDTAAIVFRSEALSLPDAPLTLGPQDQALRVGIQVGWLGFPAISSRLCFFSGRVSAWQETAYLVDGVAINGVSGGPAFHTLIDTVAVMGVVSAYMPNRATGETLPGLSIVQDVTQFHDLVNEFRSLDEAQEEEEQPSEVEQEPSAVEDDPEVGGESTLARPSRS